MPRVYTKAQRDEIKMKLMDVGLQLIKEKGVKHMSIGAVTKAVGIAQGTFYNFYQSKEELIYCIGKRYEARVQSGMDTLIREKGLLERADLRKIYEYMMLIDEDNVYRYLKRGDVEHLLGRLSGDVTNNKADAKMQMKQNLCFVKGRKVSCDFDAVINWVQVMNMTMENKDLLVEEGFEKIMLKLIDNMLDEIFES